ncbi:MAG: ABC transporter substrate-binding protein [Polyangiales bacterium]
MRIWQAQGSNVALLCIGVAAALGGSETLWAPRPNRHAAPTTGAPAHCTPVRDATGQRIMPARYRRVVSTSPVADSVLWALLEPARLTAVSRYSADEHPARHRYAGKANVASLARSEALFALRPDLVVVQHYGRPRRLAQLRTLGLRIFDLGPVHDLDDLDAAIDRLGKLLQVKGRARRYRNQLRARAQRLGRLQQRRRPRRALYLARYGGALMSAGRGSSYNSILRLAGLNNALGAQAGHPRLGAERILALRPAVLITKAGMATDICARPALRQLWACQHAAQFVLELPPFLLDSNGPEMLDAAEQIEAWWALRRR